MTESLQHIDRSCVFRETFDTAFDVSNNRYGKGTISSSGVKFENGVVSISSGGSIVYKINCNKAPFTSNGLTIRCKGYFNPNGSTNYSLINGTKGIYFSTSGSWGLYANPDARIQNPNFSAYYGKYVDVVWVLSYGFYINGIKVSDSPSGTENIKTERILTLQSGFKYDLFEIYNRALSASEIKLLYQQQLYSTPQQLPLLLDFDSTRGVLEDRTGNNVLTPTNVEIKKIGKVYSAWFNGNSSKIDCGSNIITNKHILINMWVKHNIKSSSDNNVLCSIANDSGFLVIYSTSLPIFSKALIVTNNGSSISGKNNMYDIERKFTNIIVDRNSNGYFNVWINGILQINILLSVPSYSYNTNFTIGYSTGSTNAYKGYIPKLQIFDTTNMNDNQVGLLASQLYNSQRNLFNV